jgi:hypothetical protein
LDLPGTDGANLHGEDIPIGDVGHGHPQQVKYFVDQVDTTVLIACVR